jgi:hypothetical protein
MWGSSFADLAKKAAEQASTLSVSSLTSSNCNGSLYLFYVARPCESLNET